MPIEKITDITSSSLFTVAQGINFARANRMVADSLGPQTQTDSIAILTGSWRFPPVSSRGKDYDDNYYYHYLVVG